MKIANVNASKKKRLRAEILILLHPLSHSTLRMAMHLQNSQETSEGLHAPLKIDFVRVAGRYRVGKLLGFGRSGVPNSDSSLTLL